MTEPSNPRAKTVPRVQSLSSGPLHLLLVEDSPTDRDILRYLLENRFGGDIHEAATLKAALSILSRTHVDCVLLDLQLPDSTGRETFKTLNDRYPDIPFIVMTHNKDRSLAIEMIQLGATDYMIKNFTDEEALTRRIIVAIEKHKHSVHVTTDNAATFQRLERAQADMKSAHQSGQHAAMRETTVEFTSAIADLSRKMFEEMANMSNRVTQATTYYETASKVLEHLDQELLRGQPGRPSMRSQVDLMEHRLTMMERKIEETETKKTAAESAQRQEAVALTQSRMSNKTKVVLGLLTLIGVIAGAAATYGAAVHKSDSPSAAPTASSAATHDAGDK